MPVLSGVVQTFGLSKKRLYIVLNLPFREARELFKPDIYKASTGQGEQRVQSEAHLRNLRKETEADNFTPTAVSVGLRDHHLPMLRSEAADGVVNAYLDLPDGDTLPLTDGGHRFATWEKMLKDGEERVLDFTITVMLLLDGDTQKDFLNLQKGRSVDASHMLSLRVQAGEVPGKDSDILSLAFETGLLLNKHPHSPFYKQIRFDSRGMAPLPLSSLCAKGASDCATSLVGLAKAGLDHGKLNTANHLMELVNATVKEIRRQAPELLEPGWFLTPPPDGTKGSATMLLGVTTMLLHRCKVMNQEKPSYSDWDALVGACKEVFDAPVQGSFSGPDKRMRLGIFAGRFFADIGVDKHADVPLSLVELFGTSAMGLPRLPKKKKVAADESAA